mmetsp:Transcript_30540/g.87252  ORF Transcript_30540/g.87252 Transcript_30540/m.87252 type:complete len:396 (-) Transcript_30540:215-1402(-)
MSPTVISEPLDRASAAMVSSMRARCGITERPCFSESLRRAISRSNRAFGGMLSQSPSPSVLYCNTCQPSSSASSWSSSESMSAQEKGALSPSQAWSTSRSLPSSPKCGSAPSWPGCAWPSSNASCRVNPRWLRSSPWSSSSSSLKMSNSSSSSGFWNRYSSKTSPKLSRKSSPPSSAHVACSSSKKSSNPDMDTGPADARGGLSSDKSSSTSASLPASSKSGSRKFARQSSRQSSIALSNFKGTSALSCPSCWKSRSLMSPVSTSTSTTKPGPENGEAPSFPLDSSWPTSRSSLSATIVDVGDEDAESSSSSSSGSVGGVMSAWPPGTSAGISRSSSTSSAPSAGSSSSELPSLSLVAASSSTGLMAASFSTGPRPAFGSSCARCRSSDPSPELP